MALTQEFKIDGLPFNPFVEWDEAEVVGVADDESIQPNVSITNVVFVNEAAAHLRAHRAGGITGATTGLLEGPKFEMTAFDTQNTLKTFIGCVDMVEGYVEETPVRVRCNLTRLQEKEALAERAKGVSYFLLQEEGVLNSGDFVVVPYVVEKKFNFIEFVLLSITTYLLIKELAETVRKIAEDIAEFSALAAGGFPGTGQAAAIVLFAVKTALNLAYAIILITQIIELIKDLLEFIIQPIREWRGMRLSTMAKRGMQYLGYSWDSLIPQLTDSTEFLVYLPSKNEPAPIFGQATGSTVDSPIPNSVDVGHTVEELINIINDLFTAKIKINEQASTVRQEALVNDAFWELDANFILPDVLNEAKVFNANELVGRRLMRFERDDKDDWTTDDQLGRMYEVVTHPITVNDQRCVRIKGFEETRPGVALGSRKDGLTPIELAVKAVAAIADGVINFFGGNSNLAGQVQNRVGMLRVSSQTISQPKVLLLNNASGDLKIPLNHKTKFSAKALWQNYGVNNSFVATVNGQPFRAQKRLISDEPLEIPFGFTDLITLIPNTRCTTQTGQKAKITDFRYKIAKDKARVQGWIREPWTKNLQETFYDSDDPSL